MEPPDDPELIWPLAQQHSESIGYNFSEEIFESTDGSIDISFDAKLNETYASMPGPSVHHDSSLGSKCLSKRPRPSSKQCFGNKWQHTDESMIGEGKSCIRDDQTIRDEQTRDEELLPVLPIAMGTPIAEGLPVALSPVHVDERARRGELADTVSLRQRREAMARQAMARQGASTVTGYMHFDGGSAASPPACHGAMHSMAALEDLAGSTSDEAGGEMATQPQHAGFAGVSFLNIKECALRAGATDIVEQRYLEKVEQLGAYGNLLHENSLPADTRYIFTGMRKLDKIGAIPPRTMSPIVMATAAVQRACPAWACISVALAIMLAAGCLLPGISLDLELLVTLGDLVFELAGGSRMCWQASSNLIHQVVASHTRLSTTAPASINIIAFTASAKLLELCEVLPRPLAEVMKWGLMHTFKTVPHVLGYARITVRPMTAGSILLDYTWSPAGAATAVVALGLACHGVTPEYLYAQAQKVTFKARCRLGFHVDVRMCTTLDDQCVECCGADSDDGWRRTYFALVDVLHRLSMLVHKLTTYSYHIPNVDKIHIGSLFNVVDGVIMLTVAGVAKFSASLNPKQEAARMLNDAVSLSQTVNGALQGSKLSDLSPHTLPHTSACHGRSRFDERPHTLGAQRHDGGRGVGSQIGTRSDSWCAAHPPPHPQRPPHLPRPSHGATPHTGAAIRSTVPAKKSDSERLGRNERVDDLYCGKCGQKFISAHSLQMYQIKASQGKLAKCPPRQ